MVSAVIGKIRDAGVIGAGGAGFPTHVKLSSTTKTIIVNGAECEPLLKVDQQLMEVRAEQIIQGLEIIMQLTGANEAVIGLKAKYKQAILALEKELPDKPIRLHILGDFYPAGDEQVLVYEVTGRVVPQGGIPLKVDCMVINVETILNVVGAVMGKPVTHTYLTIAGAVPMPITLRLPIGTMVAEALALAGVKNTKGLKVIHGGPMMGKVLDDLAEPITKTTKGLIVLPENHQLITMRILSFVKVIKRGKSACIQCRYCTDMCPRFLLGHDLQPHKIMRALQHIKGNEEILKTALTCSECGVCEQYACTMNLSPREVNSILKKEFTKVWIKPPIPPANQKIMAIREGRKIPVKRLIARLGLSQYDNNAPLSEQEYQVTKVQIKLKQHVGAPSISIVKVGQQVQQGELIAVVPAKALGANLHASIGGIITEIGDSIVIVPMEGSAGL